MDITGCCWLLLSVTRYKKHVKFQTNENIGLSSYLQAVPWLWRKHAVSGFTDCLSHCFGISWDSYALYGAHCRSLSFSLLSRLWFSRSLTWKRYAGRCHRHSFVSAGPPAGGHEGSGSTCLPDKSLWSHHSATPRSASCTGFVGRSAYLSSLPSWWYTWDAVTSVNLNISMVRY